MTRLTRIAVQLNNFRVIPRIALLAYGALLLYTAKWFMALPEPSPEQAGFIGAVIGAAGVFSSLYLKSGAIQEESTND